MTGDALLQGVIEGKGVAQSWVFLRWWEETELCEEEMFVIEKPSCFQISCAHSEEAKNFSFRQIFAHLWFSSQDIGQVCYETKH